MSYIGTSFTFEKLLDSSFFLNVQTSVFEFGFFLQQLVVPPVSY